VEVEGGGIEGHEGAKGQMISIIIPLMPIDPYDRVVKDCVESINKQNVNKEIIIVQQAVERYILKNRLLAEGFKRSKGDTVFFCDAD
jgi:glycosyltransferase involved in cell wall biosynthesis